MSVRRSKRQMFREYLKGGAPHEQRRQIYSRSTKNEQISASDDDAMLVYLVSPPIPPGVQVGSVKFTIKSCDQGWCSDRGPLKPYEDSWTWFSAVAISEGEANNIGDPGGVQSLITRAVLVQRNKRADSTKRMHEVFWRRGENPSRHVRQNVDEDGKGDGHGFVESLKPHDRIALIAFARYSGWINNIYEASMQISF